MTESIGRFTAAALWQDLQNIKMFRARSHMISQTQTAPHVATSIQSLGGRYLNVTTPMAALDTLGMAGTLCVTVGSLLLTSPEKMLAMQPFQRSEGAIKVVMDLGDIRGSDQRKLVARRFLKKQHPVIVRGDIWDIFDGFENHKKYIGNTYNAYWKDGEVMKPNLRDTAEKFARVQKTIVVLSDEETIVTDGDETYLVPMPYKEYHKALALHQLESALITLFMEVNPRPIDAAIHGLLVLSMAAEAAAVNANGPGTFSAHLQDAIFNLTLNDLTHRWRFNANAVQSMMATASLKMAQKPR